MELTTIINHCYRFPGFVYERAKWSADKKSIEVRVGRGSARRQSLKVSSTRLRLRPPRRTRFEFIPFWGLLVFFLYRMRRVSCQRWA